MVGNELNYISAEPKTDKHTRSHLVDNGPVKDRFLKLLSRQPARRTTKLIAMCFLLNGWRAAANALDEAPLDQPDHNMLSLPSECILNILARLPLADVVATSSCCTGEWWLLSWDSSPKSSLLTHTLHPFHTALRQAAADDCFWAALAEAKWGKDVRQLKTACDADLPWRKYCSHRMSARTIRYRQSLACRSLLPCAATLDHACVCCCRSRSPLNLLQETYPDPWQHITCCVLCSRTSGSELIRTAIAGFFEALPTPTAVLAAEGARGSCCVGSV
jgi:hypothetical protein